MSQFDDIDIKPAPELLVFTSPSAFVNNAIPFFAKVGGEAAAFDGNALRALLLKGTDAYERPVLISESDYAQLVEDHEVDPTKIYMVYEEDEEEEE